MWKRFIIPQFLVLSLSAQNYHMLPVYDSDSLQVVLKVHDTIRLETSSWISLDFINKTNHKLNLDNLGISIVLLRDSVAGRWYPEWDLDFRDIDLFREWDFFTWPSTYLLPAGKSKSSSMRIAADVGGELLSPYKIYKNATLDLEGRNVGIAVTLNFLRPYITIKSDTLRVYKAPLTSRSLDSLARHLEKALAGPPPFLEYGNWLGALLVPQLVNRVGLHRVTSALLNPDFSVFHHERIQKYLLEYGLPAPAVDSLAELAFCEGLTDDRVTLLTAHPWWRSGYEEKLVQILESSRSDRKAAENLLITHCKSWNSDGPIRVRVARELLSVLPRTIELQDSFDIEGSNWAFSVRHLILTRDTQLAVPYFKTFLDNKALIKTYGAFDFSKIPRYLPPTRICDVALEAIYFIRGQDMFDALLRISGKPIEKTYWNWESFRDKTSFLTMDYMDILRNQLIHEIQME